MSVKSRKSEDEEKEKWGQCEGNLRWQIEPLCPLFTNNFSSNPEGAYYVYGPETCLPTIYKCLGFYIFVSKVLNSSDLFPTLISSLEEHWTQYWLENNESLKENCSKYFQSKTTTTRLKKLKSLRAWIFILLFILPHSGSILDSQLS